MQFFGTSKGKNPRNERTLGIIKKRHMLPISAYIINDRILRLRSKPSFIDALLAAFAFIVLALAFPFYPVMHVSVYKRKAQYKQKYQCYRGHLVYKYGKGQCHEYKQSKKWVLYACEENYQH